MVVCSTASRRARRRCPASPSASAASVGRARRPRRRGCRGCPTASAEYHRGALNEAAEDGGAAAGMTEEEVDRAADGHSGESGAGGVIGAAQHRTAQRQWREGAEAMRCSEQRTRRSRWERRWSVPQRSPLSRVILCAHWSDSPSLGLCVSVSVSAPVAIPHLRVPDVRGDPSTLLLPSTLTLMFYAASRRRHEVRNVSTTAPRRTRAGMVAGGARAGTERRCPRYVAPRRPPPRSPPLCPSHWTALRLSAR